MKILEKPIRREIKLVSHILGMPDAEWILEFSPAGIRARRKYSQEIFLLSWQQILGMLLLHSSGGNNGKVDGSPRRQEVKTS